MNLPKEKTLANEQKVAFGELCKYLNTETSGKTFAFYHPGLPNEIGQNGKDLYEQTWEYIYEKDLLTKEKFDKHFFKNSCRDINLIFADVDLWEGIDRDAYNKNSPDYVSPGKLYEYSFADFKVREGHKNTSLFGVIQVLEEAGKAEPLSTSGHYDQYLAKWKTDAAYIFIANWSAHWSKDILEAYAAQYVAASGVLSTKALKDAAIGSMVDYTLQVGLNWAFFAKDDATIEEIAKDVDFYQIAASGAENAFSSSLGNQRTQVLLSASISCMFDGSFEDGNLRKDFNLEECAKGIASAVIANQISNFALVKLQNLDAERLKRGLLRLGIPQKEWKSFLRWLGIKNADHIAEGVEKSLEELLSGLKKVVPSHQWDKFVDDFGKDAAKLAKFDADPKLVDSWSAFKNKGLDDLARSTDDLEIVSDYMKRSGKSANDVVGEIPSSVTDAKKWLGDRKIEPFLDGSPNISSASAPDGYQIYEVNGSKYIRRLDGDNPYTPRLMVDENGVIVKYTKPARMSVSAKFSKNLEDIYGVLPTNHQRHHLVPDNVVRNSPLHQEAVKRGLYDLDRGGNGRYLAETAEDYVHDVSNLSKNYPTHLGSHPNYDAAVQSQIDNVIEQFDVDVFDLDGLSDTQLINLLSEIENRALNTLSNWQPSRLN